MDFDPGYCYFRLLALNNRSIKKNLDIMDKRLQSGQNRNGKIYLFATVFVMIFGIHALAQTEKNLNNTIRMNISNPLIFGSKSLIFGYERQFKNSQAISINMGKASLPKLSILNIDSDQLVLSNDYTEKGFHISADYRFYLQNLNKHKAPRGVYIGPYYSYHYYNHNNNWTLSSDNFTGNLQSDLKINIHTVGFELGYQFVFWKRFAVDLILIGPGVSGYGLKLKLDTSLDPDDEALFFNAVNDYLKDRFPGYNVVISDEEFKKTGSVKTTSLGFRYMINFGFRF
jgi:hypothetical protein